MNVSIRVTLIGWFAAAVLLLGAGVLLGAFIAQRPDSDSAAMQLRSDRVAHAQVRSDFDLQLQSAQSRIDQVQSELVLERAARAELVKNLSASQKDLGELKDQLAFYEQLLPPGPQGSINLRAVDIVLQDRTLFYRVLLMRSGKPGERFNGKLQFIATGLTHGKEHTYSLSPLQTGVAGNASGQPSTGAMSAGGDAMADVLKLSFEQFQRSQGLLALPEDFEPKSVTVQVLDGDIVLASRRVDL